MRRFPIFFVLWAFATGLSASPSAAAIAGRVTDADGEPLRATIRVLDEPEDRLAVPRVLRTGEDGRFEFEVPDASTRIRFESLGLVPVVLERVDPDRPLAIRLETGSSLIGRVLDSRSGESLSDASVWICDRDAAPFGFDACAEHAVDAKGRFSATGVPRDRVSLAASASGHAFTAKMVPAKRAENAFHFLELDSGSEINGRVVDDRGQPIAGARIGRSPHNLALTESIAFETPFGEEFDAEFSPALITDVNGEFRHPGVGGRKKSIYWGIAEGWFGVPSAWTYPATHASKTLELRLERPATLLFGLALEGEPVQVKVRLLRRLNSSVTEALDAELGPDGGYAFEGLPGKELKLSLRIDGYLAIDLGWVALAPATTTDLGDLPVIAGATITGTVTDGSGPVIDAAAVQIDYGHPERVSETAEVESGAFVLHGVPLNVDVRLRAGGPGFETFDETISLEADIQKEIVLVPHSSLTGRILTGDDQPVRQFTITSDESFRLSRLEHGGQDGPRSYVNVNTSSEDGSFTISPLRPGPLSITIEVDGRVPRSIPDLIVEEHRSTDIGDVYLELGHTLNGQTTRPDGSPAEGSRVWLSERTDSSTGKSLGGKQSNRDGRYQITGLQPGYFWVYAQHPDYAPWSREMQLIADVPIETLDIVFAQGGSVSGTATDRGGDPAPGVNIAVACVGLAAERATTTDDLGHYRLERLPEGTCRIGAYLKHRRPFGNNKLIVIASGRESRVDFDLSRPIEVTGTVRVDGLLADTGHVTFLTAAGGSDVDRVATATVEPATGRYRIEISESGEYRVAVESGGGRQVFAVTLADGPSAQHDFDIAVNWIRGHVVDAEGRPVRGADVTGSNGDQDLIRMMGLVTKTNTQGEFELRHLDSGTYSISVHQEGYRPGRSRSIQVTNETRIDDLQIVLEKTTDQIHGRVVDPSGAPIDDAVILAAPAGTNRIELSTHARVEPDGTFVLESPGDGALDITAFSRGWAASRLSGVTGRDEITFQLGFGGRIVATVVDRSGAPKEGLLFKLEAEPTWLGSLTLELFNSPFISGPDGVAVAERIPAGTYRVRVAGGNSGVVTVVEGEQAEVRLQAD